MCARFYGAIIVVSGNRFLRTAVTVASITTCVPISLATITQRNFLLIGVKVVNRRTSLALLILSLTKPFLGNWLFFGGFYLHLIRLNVVIAIHPASL